jgi:hypothetical protein
MQNEQLRELFIVREGKVDLFTQTIPSLTNLIQGDSFGDYQVSVYDPVQHPVHHTSKPAARETSSCPPGLMV